MHFQLPQWSQDTSNRPFFLQQRWFPSSFWAYLLFLCTSPQSYQAFFWVSNYPFPPRNRPLSIFSENTPWYSWHCCIRQTYYKDHPSVRGWQCFTHICCNTDFQLPTNHETDCLFLSDNAIRCWSIYLASFTPHCCNTTDSKYDFIDCSSSLFVIRRSSRARYYDSCALYTRRRSRAKSSLCNPYRYKFVRVAHKSVPQGCTHGKRSMALLPDS